MTRYFIGVIFYSEKVHIQICGSFEALVEKRTAYVAQFEKHCPSLRRGETGRNFIKFMNRDGTHFSIMGFAHTVVIDYTAELMHILLKKKNIDIPRYFEDNWLRFHVKTDAIVSRKGGTWEVTAAVVPAALDRLQIRSYLQTTMPQGMLLLFAHDAEMNLPEGADVRMITKSEQVVNVWGRGIDWLLN